MTRTSDLQDIPGVGPRTQIALEDLGFQEVADLKGRDPAQMYVSMCDLEGHVDRCVLYVFRSAVYYAETKRPDPELLKWWNWKAKTHPNERVEA